MSSDSKLDIDQFKKSFPCGKDPIELAGNSYMAIAEFLTLILANMNIEYLTCVGGEEELNDAISRDYIEKVLFLAKEIKGLCPELEPKGTGTLDALKLSPVNKLTKIDNGNKLSKELTEFAREVAEREGFVPEGKSDMFEMDTEAISVTTDRDPDDHTDDDNTEDSVNEEGAEVQEFHEFDDI